MSLDGRKAENPQQRQADTMSGIAQDPPKEVKPAIPAFSYAQAAKSKAPSVPATPSASMAKSETSDTGSKRDTDPDAIPSFSDSRNNPGKRTTSEGGKPQRDDFKTGRDPGTNTTTTANGTVKDPASGGQSKAAASGAQVGSNSPSPDFGASSISTLPKDDDGFSAANGSSESTWDKQSQSSHNGSKNDEKARSSLAERSTPPTRKFLGTTNGSNPQDQTSTKQYLASVEASRANEWYGWCWRVS